MVFHIVVRALAGPAPFRGTVGAAVWGALESERERTSIALVAACLMPDHLHVIARPSARSIVAWLNGWKSFTSRAAWNEGHRGALWQPSFYDRALRTRDEFESAVAYVLDNPGSAGLVSDGEVWPWVWCAEIPS
jgi:REP element-mobilizing transposase RayT